MPPAYLLHQAFVSIEFDPIANPNRPFQLERHAAHHVSERVLKRQADDCGNHCGRRNNSGEVNISGQNRDCDNNVGKRQQKIAEDARWLNMQRLSRTSKMKTLATLTNVIQRKNRQTQLSHLYAEPAGVAPKEIAAIITTKPISENTNNTAAWRMRSRSAGRNAYKSRADTTNTSAAQGKIPGKTEVVCT